METAIFHAWGIDHLAVIAATSIGIIVLLCNANRFKSQDDSKIRFSIAILLLGVELVTWVRGFLAGYVWVPLQLCDLALLLTVFALISRRPFICVLAYFWGLAGSTQAILTPDLIEPFPSFWWIVFFLTHCGIIIGVVYLAATGYVRPRRITIWHVLAVTNIYVVVAGLVNWAFGTNYGYLAHKPIQPSILDQLGPWPWYILSMEAVALLSFYLYYLPFVVARRLQSRVV